MPPMLRNANASCPRLPSGIVYGKVDFNASAALDVDEGWNEDELALVTTGDDDILVDVDVVDVVDE